jgi:hypothetical protein
MIKLLILATLFVITIGLAGCRPAFQVIGTWDLHENKSFTFVDNKQFISTYRGEDTIGTYTLRGDKLVTRHDDRSETYTLLRLDSVLLFKDPNGISFATFLRGYTPPRAGDTQLVGIWNPEQSGRTPRDILATGYTRFPPDTQTFRWFSLIGKYYVQYNSVVNMWVLYEYTVEREHLTLRGWQENFTYAKELNRRN